MEHTKEQKDGSIVDRHPEQPTIIIDMFEGLVEKVTCNIRGMKVLIINGHEEGGYIWLEILNKKVANVLNYHSIEGSMLESCLGNQLKEDYYICKENGAVH